MLSYFVTTVVGIEDICAQELSQLIGADTELGVGKVFFKGGLDTIYRVNFASRTTSRLFIQLVRDRVTILDDVYRLLKSVEYSDYLRPDTAFAVRCERLGKHSFTSLDIARVAGKAVIDSYMDSKGVRLKVNLDNPDVEIRVFLRDDELIAGVNTTGEGLHKRRYRVYSHPAAIKTTIASAMLKIGGYAGEPLLDPLCGGGTIPIEAAHAARRMPIVMFRQDYMFRSLTLHDPLLEREIAESLVNSARRDLFDIYCMDISPKHLRGAIENARSALVDDTIRFLQRDATRAESHLDLSADLIITNPPYGIRSHNLKKIEQFYISLLNTLYKHYTGSKLVIITASTKQFEEAVQRAGLGVEHCRTVLHGGLKTKIYRLSL